MSDHQPSLFDASPEPWELDDEASRLICRVVFPEGLVGVFDYEVPDSLRASLEVGMRVKVPLGRSNRKVIAYCVELEPEVTINRRLKAILEVVDETPLVSPTMLRLTEWMANHYLAGWGRVLEAVIPAGVRTSAGTQNETFYSVPTRVAAGWMKLKLPAKQKAIMELLLSAPNALARPKILQRIGCTVAPLKSLEKKQLVVSEQRRMMRSPKTSEQVPRGEPVALSATQQHAIERVVDCLAKGEHRNFLLHGVTGSGKTEVYIRAIEEVIRFRRQAIVLVPEISLTPQTRRRFRARFRRVAVLHSHLTDWERNWHWQQIASGDVQVVVGARSAVFAPTPNLGLIVIDEEHDGSFKQDSLPRYHARDVARRRAEAESIPLILGSATPSLESWVMAEADDSERLSMPNRILDLPLPEVRTIDLRHDFTARKKWSSISQELQVAVKRALGRGEQVILLLNRRGFSTHIQCPACGNVVSCPQCDLPLTHHLDGERAVCHYCEYNIHAPKRCPDCRFEGIRYGGLGTQRLEAEVQKIFPKATVRRMDSDTMRKPGSHEQTLDLFRNQEIQILVGTQMIAKGLDFPNVTVVGVINADTALNLPDFRAAERTFQLVTQVAGRTGRGTKGGRVYLQTFNPDHPAIRAAERHDYLRFAEYELPIRKQFGYPPYGAMARVIVRGPIEAHVQQWADLIAQKFDALVDAGSCRRLGPAPAPMPKLRGNYRYHMILQSPELAPLQAILSEAQVSVKPTDDVQWQADIDPTEML